MGMFAPGRAAYGGKERREMSRSTGRHEINMTEGPLAGKILSFAIPLMFSSLLQLLFNAADVIVVGRYVGDAALGAVGSTGAIINFLLSVMNGFSVGVNVVVAHDIGAGQSDNVRRAVHSSVLLALVTGVGIMGAGLLLSRRLLVFTGSVPDVIDLADIYMKIYFCGVPAAAIYNFVAGILRARGDTRRPLYILTVAGVMNAGLNVFFVRAFGMSVDGVALATIISQYFSAIMVLIILFREKGDLKLELKRLRFSGKIVRRIVTVGIPSSVQGIVFAIANMQVQAGVNSFNDTVLVAATSASNNIETFVYMAEDAFYQACVTFVSRNYGAGKTRRIDRAVLLCLLFVTLTGMLFGFSAYFFGEQLLSLYAPGRDDVIAAGIERLAIICLPHFICGIMNTLVGALRGIGYSVTPMVTSIGGCCVLRLIWIYTIFRKYHEPWVIFLTLPVSWVITAVVNGVIFLIVRRRAYARVSVDAPVSAGDNPVKGEV